MTFFGVAVVIETAERDLGRAPHDLGATASVLRQREIVLGIRTGKRKLLGLRPVTDGQYVRVAVPDVSLGAGIGHRREVDGVALAEAMDRAAVEVGQRVVVVDERLVEAKRAGSRKRHILVEEIGEMGNAVTGDHNISVAVYRRGTAD